MVSVSATQILMMALSVPVMVLWVLHEVGYNDPVVRVLCWMARVVSFGKWHPKPENVDRVAAVSVSGVGLGILTVMLASWVG